MGEEVMTAGGPQAGEVKGGEGTDGGAISGSSSEVEYVGDAT